MVPVDTITDFGTRYRRTEGLTEMRIRDYYNSLVTGSRRGTPRYDEARRDFTEALRARTRI
jgi:hypothetical protein